MKSNILKITICLLAVTICLSPNTVFAADDYSDLYNEVLEKALSINESVEILNKNYPDYPNKNLYEQAKPIVESVVAGKITVFNQEIDIKNPSAISFSFGPVKQDIVPVSEIKDVTKSMLTVFLSILTPVEQQLKYDALDYTPANFENIAVRAELYTNDVKLLIEDVTVLLNENNFSEAINSKNFGKILQLMISDKKDPQEVINTALDIILNTPNLGSDVAVEVGLLAARATTTFNRINKLYSDAEQWYSSDPVSAKTKTGKEQNDYLADLKSTVESPFTKLDALIDAAVKSVFNK